MDCNGSTVSSNGRTVWTDYCLITVFVAFEHMLESPLRGRGWSFAYFVSQRTMGYISCSPSRVTKELLFIFCIWCWYCTKWKPYNCEWILLKRTYQPSNPSNSTTQRQAWTSGYHSQIYEMPKITSIYCARKQLTQGLGYFEKNKIYLSWQKGIECYSKTA